MENRVVGMTGVKWASNPSKNFSYRRGLDGKMELVAVQTSDGGYYQPEWLPVLKSAEYTQRPPNRFGIGDRVKMVGTVQELKEKQLMHGGWTSSMEEVTKSVKTFLTTVC